MTDHHLFFNPAAATAHEHNEWKNRAKDGGVNYYMASSSAGWEIKVQNGGVAGGFVE